MAMGQILTSIDPIIIILHLACAESTIGAGHQRDATKDNARWLHLSTLRQDGHADQPKPARSAHHLPTPPHRNVGAQQGTTGAHESLPNCRSKAQEEQIRNLHNLGRNTPSGCFTQYQSR
jgi:hypothetical protein